MSILLLLFTFVIQDIDWNNCWDPRVYFFNAVTIDKLECKHNIVPNDDDSIDGVPDAQLSIRMKATFKTAMQLHSFPYDHQVQQVFISFSYVSWNIDL